MAVTKFTFNNDEMRFFEVRENGQYTFYKDINSQLTLATKGFKLCLEFDTLVVHGNETNNEYGKTIWVTYQDINTDSREYHIYMLSNANGVSIDMSRRIFKEHDFESIHDLVKYYNNGGKIKGIGEKKIIEVQKAMENSRKMETENKFCVLLGNDGLAKKLAKKCDLEEFNKEPYLYLRSAGLGFKRADWYAINKLNITLDNVERVKYLIEYKFTQFNVACSNFVNKNEFVSYLTNDVEIKGDALSFIENNDLLVEENENIYLKEVYEAESQTPAMLAELNANPIRINDVDEIIAEHQAFKGFNLHDTQISAIKKVLEEKISILSGGAGCGKTTVIDCIIRVLENNGINVGLFAPTGRAAKRITESTKRPAGTIHSLICFAKYILPEADTWTAENFLTERFGMRRHGEYHFFIDESSMIDQVLLYDFLMAVSEINEQLGFQVTGITFVGDPSQLPSVGCGNVLKDMIESGVINHAELTQVFRQGKESEILKNAVEVRNKRPIEFLKNSEFYVAEIKPGQFERIYKRLQEKYDNEIDRYQNIQIISPLNKSCEYYNDLLKSKSDEKFAVGDKVVNCKNSYELDIMNGDVGIIENVEVKKNDNEKLKKFYTIFFYDRNFRLTFTDMTTFKLAYALTVHKCQGCQYPYVIIVVDRDSSILDHQMFYTAITRASELCVILYNDTATINAAATRDMSWRRKTRFKEKLIDNI